MFFPDNSGWVMKRRGIINHLYSGKLTATEYLVHDLLLLMADKSTGVWRGSAPALVAIAGGSLRLRATQDAMVGLEEKGYILRARTEGKKGNFPILIDKYHVQTGTHKDKQLLVSLTKAADRPHYAPLGPRTDTGTDSGKKIASKTGDLALANTSDTWGARTDDSTETSIERGTETSTLTILNTKKETTNNQVGSVGDVSGTEKEQVHIKLSSEELALVNLCYRLSNKPVPVNVPSASVQKVKAALAAHSLSALRELLQYCDESEFWRKQFTNASLPVNYFVKSIPTLAQQVQDRKQKPATKGKRLAGRKRSVAEIEELVAADYSVWKINCSRCNGRELIVSQHTQKELPCPECQKRKAELRDKYKKPIDVGGAEEASEALDQGSSREESLLQISEWQGKAS